jgi:hypothetical protein
VFSGKRWETQVYPIVKNMILSSDEGPIAARSR